VHALSKGGGGSIAARELAPDVVLVKLIAVLTRQSLRKLLLHPDL